MVFLKLLSFLKQLFGVSSFHRPSLSICDSTCVFSRWLIQFLNLSVSCPQPPAMTILYVWGTQFDSYSLYISWGSGLGTLFRAEGLQSALRCLYTSQDSYIQILEKSVCEGRQKKIQYGHRSERKCHHMWKYLHMSFFPVEVSRDNKYYIFKFLRRTGYRDSHPSSCSRWTIYMEQAVHRGTVSSLNSDHQ